MILYYIYLHDPYDHTFIKSTNQLSTRKCILINTNFRKVISTKKYTKEIGIVNEKKAVLYSGITNNVI